MSARKAALCVTYLVFTAFYLWTATTGGQGLQFGGAQNDYYNQQTNGFLAGELSLPTLPPKGLLDLPNPYSPAQNTNYRPEFLDLALYHGHFYLPWGPAPVLTLFLPWRILHIGGLPQNLALFIYCAVGLGFALALLAFLVRRFVPRARTWQVELAAIALATGNVAPFLLRTIQVYEVAEACSYCFAMIGLYCFARGALDERRRARMLALGSLALGLSAGGHVDCAFLGVIPLGVAIAFWHKSRGGALRARLVELAPVLVPFAICIVALLAFNVARFHSPFQYGQTYQLAGGWDQEVQPVNQPGYLAPNLYYFMVAPPRFDLIFPYFFLAPPPGYPGVLPASYIGLEISSGVLATTPILLWLAALPFLARRRFPKALSVGLVLTLAAGALIALFLSFAIWGATMRYEASFAPLFLLPAVFCWVATGQSRRAVRYPSLAIGALAIVVGAFVGLAISITGYTNPLQQYDQGQFNALRSGTSPFATFVSMLAGHPVITWVNPQNGANYGNVSYLELGEAEWTELDLGTTTVDVQLVSPSSATWQFVFTADPEPGITLNRRPLRIVVVHGHTTLVERFLPGRANRIDVPLDAGLNDVYLTLRLPKSMSDNGGNPIYATANLNIVAPK